MKEWQACARSENHSIGDDLILLKKDEAPHNIEGVHQLHWYTIVMCLRGTFHFEINYTAYTAVAPCYIVVQKGQICKLQKLDDECSYRAIMLSKQYFDHIFSEINASYAISFMLNKNPIQQGKSGGTMVMDYLFGVIENILSSDIAHNHFESIKHVFLCFFYAYGNDEFFKATNAGVRGTDVVQNFCTLLEQNYRRDRTIAYYAEELDVSINYLEKMVKRDTGKTVLDCIEERIATEAKYLLVSTSMSMAEISEYLGFVRQSAFSKFFRRTIGMTPSEFCKSKPRKSQREEDE